MYLTDAFVARQVFFVDRGVRRHELIFRHRSNTYVAVIHAIPSSETQPNHRPNYPLQCLRQEPS